MSYKLIRGGGLGEYQYVAIPSRHTRSVRA